MPITKQFRGALKFYLIGAFATLLSGYDTGNIGGALLFVKQDMNLSALGEGWVVSSLIIGAIVGSVGGGRLADRVGRRPTIVVMAYLFLVGCLGEAISPSLGSLAAFRVIVGLSVGCASVVVPIYIAELAPAEARGSLTSLFQLMIVIGTLLGYGVDAALGHAEAWRWMFALGAIPAIALLFALRVVPETPRWLYRRGRVDAARRVLVQLRGAGDVEPELDRMRSLATARPPTRRSWSALRSTRNRRALVIGIGLAIFTQITGINTIIYYAPTILTTIGLGTSVALILNVGLGAWAIVAMLFEIALIDRVGRKPLLALRVGRVVLEHAGGRAVARHRRARAHERRNHRGAVLPGVRNRVSGRLGRHPEHRHIGSLFGRRTRARLRNLQRRELVHQLHRLADVSIAVEGRPGFM